MSLIRPHVIGAIFRRELRGYFTTPIGYVFISLFIVASAALLFVYKSDSGDFFGDNLCDLGLLNHFMPWLLLFFVPAVTMSIWAEERRQGTDALLLTLPASDADIVLGKYLAVLGIYTVALLFSTIHILLLWRLGSPDGGLMVANYFGYWLMGGAMLAAGMIGSMLSRNATIGFLFGILVCGFLIVPELLGWLSATMKAWVHGPADEEGAARTLRQVTVWGACLGISGAIVAIGYFTNWMRSIALFIVAMVFVAITAMRQELWDGAGEFGVVTRFHRFGEGEIVLADFIYFVGLTAALLFINMILVGRRHWAGGERSRFRWVHALVRCASIVVAVLAGVMLFGYTNLRADVTSERLHTISPVTEAAVAKVATFDDSRVCFIEAFVSPDVPQEYVRNKIDLLSVLERMDERGRGRIRVKITELKPFTAAAREAKDSYGIRAIPVADSSSGRAVAMDIFLGVAVTCGIEREVIPFLAKGLVPEYEVTRAIRAVTGASRRRLGILDTALPLFGSKEGEQETADSPIVAELKKQYTVVRLDPESPYATATRTDHPELFVDALVAIMPTLLTQKGIDNLKAYVEAGRPSLLLVDPAPRVFGGSVKRADLLNERMRGKGFAPSGEPEKEGDFKPVLDALGVSVDMQEMIWDRHNPHPKRPDLKLAPEVYVFAQNAVEQWTAFNADDPACAGLNEVLFCFAVAVRSTAKTQDAKDSAKARPSTIVTPLIVSSKKSGTIRFQDVNLPYNKRPASVYLTEPDNAQLFIAARVSGAMASGKTANCIVVGDADFIIDQQFWSMRLAGNEEFKFDNVNFVLNAVDSLAGDDELVALRSRQSGHRTLTTIEASRQEFENALKKNEEKTEADAKREMEAAQTDLDQTAARIDQMTSLDTKSREQLKASSVNAARAQFDVKKKQIEANKEANIAKEREKLEARVSAIEDGYRVWALILPPVPALVLGIVFFVLRRRRELASVGERRIL